MMRSFFFLTLLALAGCGDLEPDDPATRNGASARETAITTTAAAPVRIGELGPNFDACATAGTTRRVPAGEALAVQAAPFASAAMAATIPSGARFFVCSRSLDQKWFGIVYDPGGTLAAGCGVSTPVATRRDYAGPCRSGWVSSVLVKLIAGNDEAPPPPVPPQTAP